MAAPPRFASAAHRWARSRRWLLLGNHGPFLARYAPRDLPTPDRAEDGDAAIWTWALWRTADKIDAGLARLASVRLDQGGRSMGIAEALGAAAVEPDRDAAAALLRTVALEVRAPGLELAGAFARAAESAAERGLPRVVEPDELKAAGELLAISDEPVRDVLNWATLRLGRSPRAPLALADVLRVLRNPTLDRAFHPVADPWPAIAGWRQTLALDLAATTEVAVEADAWMGSWALRGRRSRLVGASGWPGALRARFALQGLGRLDVLSEGGHAALLPRDPSAAQIPAAVYPMLLAEAVFPRRVFDSGGRSETWGADSRRLIALSELLLQRAQAAALQLCGAFDQTREVEAVKEATAALSRALCASVPSELALLAAAPWTDGLSAPPSAVMTGTALIESWRESFDEDFWRNPRFAEPLRGLVSRCARESLVDLAPKERASGAAAYARWVESCLGG